MCKDLLVRHGGHAGAAGFTVRNENLPEFVARPKEVARNQLPGRDLRHSLFADMEVSLTQLSMEVLDHREYLEPTGYGNPSAVFVSRDVKIKSFRPVGADGKHLKVTLDDECGGFMDCIGFRMGPQHTSLQPRVDILYNIELNEYNGRKSLQLNLKDLKPAGTPD